MSNISNTRDIIEVKVNLQHILMSNTTICYNTQDTVATSFSSINIKLDWIDVSISMVYAYFYLYD